MDHLGYKNMKKLVKHTEGLKLNLNDLKENEKLCEICQKAKQSRVNLMNQEQEQQDHCRLYTQISAIQLTQLRGMETDISIFFRRLHPLYDDLLTEKQK